MTAGGGEEVVLAHVHHGRVWWASPARVVEDSDDLVVLWWPAGTRYLRPAGDDRLELLQHLAEGTWELEETTWWGGDALMVIPSDAEHSIWPFRTADGDLLGWYCNLQERLRRTKDGFATNDWTLDIWAAPDLSSWRWKDEDELLEGQRVGLYTDDDVARIRAAGAAVVDMIEQRHALFDAWRDWHPPTAWAAPRLPAGFSE